MSVTNNNKNVLFSLLRLVVSYRMALFGIGIGIIVVVVDGVSLQEIWDIGEPEFEHDLLDFTLAFTVSDYMEDTMVGYKIYDGLECTADGGTENEITVNDDYLVSQLVPDNTTLAGEGFGVRVMEVTMSLDPDTIANSTIYRRMDTTNETDDTALVELCLRFSNYHGDKDSPGAIEINFLDNPIVLVIDFAEEIDYEYDLEIGELEILEHNTTGITIVLGGEGIGMDAVDTDMAMDMDMDIDYGSNVTFSTKTKAE